MSCIFRGVPFADKNMTQVTATISACDFRAPAIGIERFFHRASNFLVKARPAAARMKFGARRVERRVALATYVGAFDKKIVVQTGAGQLSAFVNNDVSFFSGKFV